MVRAVHGSSNEEFTDNLMKEEMHDQRRIPDRFILKAGSFGRKGRGK
jgi:hypothetical protein